MTTDINMSLDEIIKKNKSIRNFNPRRKRGNANSGANSNAARPLRRTSNLRSAAGGGGGFGGPRIRNNAFRSRSAARFSPYKRGDIDSPWSHDLYDDGFMGKQRGGGDYSEGTKVIISNLEFGVTDSDLEELFLEIGSLVSSEIHYDKSGRSLGSGSVVFEERTDAIRAINQYNGIPLDGRPMKIEIATSNPGRITENRSVMPTFRNRNVGIGGGGGSAPRRRRFNGNFKSPLVNRNSRRNNNTTKLSAEQLDAELDEYRAKGL